MAATTNMEKALDISRLEMLLFQKFSPVFPFIVVRLDKEISRNVDVLIPPPVDPDEAPINISTIIKIIVAFDICEKSMVLNPAVLVVTL